MVTLLLDLQANVFNFQDLVMLLLVAILWITRGLLVLLLFLCVTLPDNASAMRS